MGSSTLVSDFDTFGPPQIAFPDAWWTESFVTLNTVKSLNSDSIYYIQDFSAIKCRYVLI